MLNWKFLRRHRTYEDWLGITLGIVIALAPWITNETSNHSVIVNAAVVGIAIMTFAELDLVHFRRWAEIGQLICGVWIAASALVFGYAASGTLRYWHVLAGLLVALLGSLEIWQLRNGEEPDRQDQ